MAAVLHHSRARGTAKLVLLGIANHAGDGGAWPAMDTLARYANVDRSNVKKALRALQGLGEVRVYVQGGGPVDADDGRRPNRYDVLVACPLWCDRTAQHRDTRARTSQPALVVVDNTVESVDETGGGIAPPGGIAPRRGGASAPLTVHLNQPPPGSSSTTDRARGPACGICSQTEARCRGLSTAVSGHTYQPRSLG